MNINTQDYMDSEMINQLAALMTLEDKDFEVLAPHVLDAIDEGLRKENYLRECARGVKESHITRDEIKKELELVLKTVDEQFDETEYSKAKREFMRQFYIKIYNSILSVIDKSQRAVNIPIELCNPDAKIPTYAHEGDAGADVYSPIDVTLAPGETKIIPLGFKVAIPDGYELQIRPRSGLSARTHLRVANAPGTIKVL